MKCPKCNQPLTTIFHEGISIETCPNCEGEWLDHSEISHIIHTVEQQFTPQEIALVEGLNKPVIKELKQPENPLLCPHCTQPLTAINYNYSTGVIIDRCTNCHGIWVDKNELEHLQIIMEERHQNLGETKTRFESVLRKISDEYHQNKHLTTQKIVTQHSDSRTLQIPLLNTFINAILYRLIH